MRAVAPGARRVGSSFSTVLIRVAQVLLRDLDLVQAQGMEAQGTAGRADRRAALATELHAAGSSVPIAGAVQPDAPAIKGICRPPRNSSLRQPDSDTH